MQKHFIGLALASIGFSGAAFAQSNVTIYGVADVSIESSKAEGATTVNVPRRNRINTNGSLIGFKGTEDLGDGLSAIYQFESNINNDSGTVGANTSGSTGSFSTIGASNPTLFGSARDTYVGVKGEFGTVKAGYISTPLRVVVKGFDVMPGSTGVGEIGGIFATTAPNTSLLFRTQAVAYDSPNLSGFSGSLAYFPNEGKSNSAVTNEVDPTGWSAALTYKTGGLKLAYTYMKIEDAGVAGLLDEAIKTNIVGASYDFGQGTTLVGLYQDTDDDRTALTAAASGTVQRKAYWVAAKHVMGANEFALSYAKADELDSSVVTTPSANTGAKQIAFRYARVLSKRTQVYGIYSKITNESAATFDFNTAPIGVTGNAIAAGADPTSYGVGVRHSF